MNDYDTLKASIQAQEVEMANMNDKIRQVRTLLLQQQAAIMLIAFMMDALVAKDAMDTPPMAPIPLFNN